MEHKGASEKKVGQFVWYSLQTTDPQKAVEFYTKLFGLESVSFELPGMGTFPVLKKSGMQFADIATPPADVSSILNADGRQSRWMTNIAVEDVDKFVSKAKQSGGQVKIPPFDMPSLGRSALVYDSSGAAFMPFTPNDWDRTESAMGSEEGMVCWNELMTHDPKSAMRFYSEVMGWSFEKMPGDQEYYAFGLQGNERRIGGVFPLTAEHGPMKPTWMPYFCANNVDATTEKAASLGATIWVKSKDIPNVGCFSIASDPMGAGFYIFKGQPAKP